ncbi:MAG: cytidylyltransferase domain-containing protein [Nitrosotalea sp.]
MAKDGKVVAVVQTRMGSTRLPGKVMKEICGKPMLSLMLERLSHSKLIDEIIVATTYNKNDDIIYDLAKKYKYPVFRGSEFDCLDRHYQAAKQFGARYVAKITPDCPLIDPEVTDKVIGYFLKNSNNYDYVSNAHSATFPDGLDVEIFHLSALEAAWKEAKNPSHREHTTTYIWSQPTKFRIGNVVMDNGKNLFMQERWTVDFQEDFEFVKAIYENLYHSGRIFLMNEILEFLEKRKDIWNINHHLAIHNAVH